MGILLYAYGEYITMFNLPLADNFFCCLVLQSLVWSLSIPSPSTAYQVVGHLDYKQATAK